MSSDRRSVPDLKKLLIYRFHQTAVYLISASGQTDGLHSPVHKSQLRKAVFFVFLGWHRWARDDTVQLDKPPALFLSVLDPSNSAP